MSGGVTPDCKLLTGRAEFAQRAVELAGMAKMELLLFSYKLDASIYGREEFIEPLKMFLLTHSRTRLRGLVNSSQTAARSGNRLIELSRRLSSRIEFRQLLDERLDLRDEYLICDTRNYIHRRDPRELEARDYRDAPLQTLEMIKQFELLWQESPPAREFTDLKL